MAVLPAPDILTVTTRHGSVRVRDTGGAGTPVLLVHALLTDPDLYARLIPLLIACGYRCIVPELPLGGHRQPLNPDADLSPPGIAALIVDVLDHLGLERVHAVGVDTGGALTQIVMARHAERVERVILTACDAYQAFPPASLRPLLLLLRLPGALWLTGQLARPRFVRRLLTARPVSHHPPDDATVRRWVAPLRDRRVRHDLGKVLADMKPAYTLAAAAANRAFPRPVLIAWGDDDLIFPRRLAERLAADLPQAERVTLPDCAAFAALDQPALLAEHIDRHLRAPVPVAVHA